MNNRGYLTPYENLANAIIIQAAKDYKKVLKKEKQHPQSQEV